MKKLIILFFISFSWIFSADYIPEIHCKHFLFGYPIGTPKTNDMIIRDAYALSSNDSTKFADWVCYLMDSTTITGSTKDRKWSADPWLDDAETLEPNDYNDAPKALKIDRGHQAPLASLKGASDWFTTNYLSNITPQKADLNQGVWKNLEDKARDLVPLYGQVWVFTGPLYEREMPKMPKANENHIVPSGYWMIISVFDGDKLKTIGFIMDQETPRKSEFKNHLATINDIEKRSKLDFFRELEDKEEWRIESKINTDWFEIDFIK